MDSVILKIIEIVQTELEQNESIVDVRLAQPRAMSRADYFTRYKVKVGKINGSGTSVTAIRCLIIEFSSNRQTASIDYVNTCDAIDDVLFD